MKAAIEGFQPVYVLADGIWDPWGSASGSDVERCGHQSQHPLPLEAALEGADGVRMGRRFLGPVRGRPIGQEHQGPDHFIAPLGRIDEAQLQWRKRRGRFHRSSFTCVAREAYITHWREIVI
jgi:hypothetical protein